MPTQDRQGSMNAGDLIQTAFIKHRPMEELQAASREMQERDRAERAREEAYQEARAAARRAAEEARRNAKAVRVTKDAPTLYTNAPEKDAPEWIHEGDVIDVTGYAEKYGWTVVLDGFKRIVPIDKAEPCEPQPAQEPPEPHRTPDRPTPAAQAQPAQDAPQRAAQEAAETPRTDAEPTPATVDRAHAKSGGKAAGKGPRANAQTGEIQAGKRLNDAPTPSTLDGLPWSVRRPLDVARACIKAGCGAHEMGVMLAMTRCQREGDETVWRPAADVCAELGITDKQRQNALNGLRKRGLLTIEKPAHRGRPAEYRVNI